VFSQGTKSVETTDAANSAAPHKTRRDAARRVADTIGKLCSMTSIARGTMPMSTAVSRSIVIAVESVSCEPVSLSNSLANTTGLIRLDRHAPAAPHPNMIDSDTIAQSVHVCPVHQSTTNTITPTIEPTPAYIIAPEAIDQYV